ncbi:hypothetical protein BJ508DRAFT_314668 [Ascobolus immersus RN42]|uniref:F-box domain-containing protein n=1 Tax=Ascobolus immersus RN42 TaxID=1160509 RepID=A0A3N4HHL9_ASCIM|nr:hypothetical protein BJ508DRAFT_314668 [Ascobolus immersus RN42]
MSLTGFPIPLELHRLIGEKLISDPTALLHLSRVNHTFHKIYLSYFDASIGIPYLSYHHRGESACIWLLRVCRAPTSLLKSLLDPKLLADCWNWEPPSLPTPLTIPYFVKYMIDLGNQRAAEKLSGDWTEEHVSYFFSLLFYACMSLRVGAADYKKELNVYNDEFATALAFQSEIFNDEPYLMEVLLMAGGPWVGKAFFECVNGDLWISKN